MGYYTDISNSQYAAQDTALQNRLNGVNGHTVLGAVLSSNATGIFGLVTSFVEKSGKESDATGPDIDPNYTAEAEAGKQRSFNEARTAFNATPNKTTAKALQEAYDANPSSTNETALKLCKEKYPTYFS